MDCDKCTRKCSCPKNRRLSSFLCSRCERSCFCSGLSCRICGYDRLYNQGQKKDCETKPIFLALPAYAVVRLAHNVPRIGIVTYAQQKNPHSADITYRVRFKGIANPVAIKSEYLFPDPSGNCPRCMTNKYFAVKELRAHKNNFELSYWANYCCDDFFMTSDQVYFYMRKIKEIIMEKVTDSFHYQIDLRSGFKSA